MLAWIKRLSRKISASISGSKKSLNETFTLLEKAGEMKSARSDLAMFATLELDSLRHEANILMQTIIIYVVFIVLGYLSLYLEIVIAKISGDLSTSEFYIAGLIFMACIILVMVILWLRLNYHLRYCEKRLRIIWKKAVAERLFKAPEAFKGIKL